MRTTVARNAFVRDYKICPLLLKPPDQFGRTWCLVRASAILPDRKARRCGDGTSADRPLYVQVDWSGSELKRLAGKGPKKTASVDTTSDFRRSERGWFDLESDRPRTGLADYGNDRAKQIVRQTIVVAICRKYVSRLSRRMASSGENLVRVMGLRVFFLPVARNPIRGALKRSEARAIKQSSNP